MEDNLNNRRKLFAVTAVISIIVCYLVVRYTWPTPAERAEKLAQSAAESKTIIAYEPKDPAEQAKIDKLIKDFVPHFIETSEKMSPDDFRNGIKPYVSEKIYQQMGALPAAKKTVLKDFRVVQTGNYYYTIYFEASELKDDWIKIDNHISVFVDKDSCLISRIGFH